MLRFCLVNVRSLAVYFANAHSQRFSEKEKLGKPKEEFRILKMGLNICILIIPKYNICKLNIFILVILRYNISNLIILRIHISYFRGHDTGIHPLLPSCLEVFHLSKYFPYRCKPLIPLLYCDTVLCPICQNKLKEFSRYK